MRQPGHKASREAGRVLATTFHEPRYYYGVDALDLIDLRAVDSKDSKEAPDKLRAFLQRHVPKTMLDKTGKERREIDEVDAQGILPSGEYESSLLSSRLNLGIRLNTEQHYRDLDC